MNTPTKHPQKYQQAFDFAAGQLRRLIETHPDYFPMYTTNGRWQHTGEAWTNWWRASSSTRCARWRRR